MMQTSLDSYCISIAATIPVHGRNRQKSFKTTGHSKPHHRATGTPYARRADAMRFADDLAERRDLDREWVRQAIGQARFLAQVPRLVLPPAKGTAKNWQAVPQPLHRAGAHPRRRALLAGPRTLHWRAPSSEYGVPAEIIVGIIGVETIYHGQHMGNFRVMDALATLAFDFPCRTPARPGTRSILPAANSSSS